MKAIAIWLAGIAYVLAALFGTIVVVWAADLEDNSADPTPWALGAVIVMAPTVIGGAALVSHRLRRLLFADLRVTAPIGVAVGAVLIFGAWQMIADAAACNDDDCVSLAVPLAALSVMGGWSLPLAVAALRRLRYPAPLVTLALFSATLTFGASVVAATIAGRRVDDFADLALAVIVALWMVPSALAAVAAVVGHRADGVVRTTAGVALSMIGVWFIALPLVAGVEGDRPVLFGIIGGPGAALLVVGLATLRRCSR